MKRAVCVVILCAVLLCLLPITVYADNRNVTVYVTNSGTKYHKSGCSYLKSSHAVTLEYAITNGYTACSRCHPPIPDFGVFTAPKESEVFITTDTGNSVDRFFEERGQKEEDRPVIEEKITVKSDNGYAKVSIIAAAVTGISGFILGSARKKKR